MVLFSTGVVGRRNRIHNKEKKKNNILYVTKQNINVAFGREKGHAYFTA
jgi:hypothetical protein